MEKDLKGAKGISDEHVDNNKPVRKMLLERGAKPESLPPSEDVSKVKRRLKMEDKQVPGDVKKTRIRTTKKISPRKK